MIGRASPHHNKGQLKYGPAELKALSAWYLGIARGYYEAADMAALRREYEKVIECRRRGDRAVQRAGVFELRARAKASGIDG